MTIRVFVCNSIYLYTEGLKQVLEDDPSIWVVGLACDESGLRGLEDIDPDVVVTDSACFPKVAGRVKKILLVWDNNAHQASPPFDSLKKMIDQGVVGIISARTDAVMLKKAVVKTNLGELWLNRQFIHDSLCTSASHPGIELSHREAEILRCICKGDSNKEIATKLYISEKTVKAHCNHLFKKFGVSSRLKLALQTSSEEWQEH